MTGRCHRPTPSGPGAHEGHLRRARTACRSARAGRSRGSCPRRSTPSPGRRPAVSTRVRTILSSRAIACGSPRTTAVVSAGSTIPRPVTVASRRASRTASEVLRLRSATAPATPTSASTASPDRANVATGRTIAPRSRVMTSVSGTVAPGQHAWAPTRFATVLRPMSRCDARPGGAHYPATANRSGGHTHASHDTHLRTDRLHRDGRGYRTVSHGEGRRHHAHDRAERQRLVPQRHRQGRLQGQRQRARARGRRPAHPVARRQARQRHRERPQHRHARRSTASATSPSTATPASVRPCRPSRRAPRSAYAPSAARWSPAARSDPRLRRRGGVGVASRPPRLHRRYPAFGTAPWVYVTGG